MAAKEISTTNVWQREDGTIVMRITHIAEDGTPLDGHYTIPLNQLKDLLIRGTTLLVEMAKEQQEVMLDAHT